MTRFQGKVVLVTGAGSGIGAATAELFRTEGANVVGVDLTGDGTTVMRGDVADPASVRSFVDATIERYGGIDVVANVAGMVRFSHVEQTTFDDWQRHLAVNLTGPFLVSQTALPSLLERKGCIVNVASIAGLRGQAYTAAYCASKGGLVLLTKSMGLELASRGVRVNAVCPSSVMTPMVQGVAETMPHDLDPKLMARLMSPNDGWVTPGEIAESIAYLASDAARNITGTTLLVDGGTQS
ncbi:MAG TPA: SDR family NAD(P)-dependent oxidoreductase [Jatrophihabitantaceae bacterium]|jgi:NAD(P)-dependent dehydrogenase (short-subunit alcohol dehydrogenase family)|nr:SDR family NAD(P)-dependent oxidoreductase [Jatrophihabitantaceae bacterium]